MGIQKAIAAFIGGGAIILNELFGAQIGIAEGNAQSIANGLVAILTVAGVYTVSNK